MRRGIAGVCLWTVLIANTYAVTVQSVQDRSRKSPTASQEREVFQTAGEALL
jgi:hypothetical protein